ncbi:MAG: hypothetical protein NTZ92_06060 [Candidatus Omnitrophica bacterium]|nr:hypothetical protein [Candidatus Omnitrophota bacterium]
MRKLKIILVLVLFSLSLAGCEMFAWRKYNNREYKFSFIVLKDWDIDEDVRDSVLAINIPKEDPDDLFTSNIRVMVEDLPAPIDLATYYDINREEFKQIFKKMGDVTEGQGMSGFVRHQWIAFTAPLDDRVLIRAISAVWIKDKRVYVLTCVMDLQRAQQIEPVFRKMLASFRIQ